MICKACDQDGHRAFFCPYFDAPNLQYHDSGHRAFQELPFHTHRWTLLKQDLLDARLALQEDSSPAATKAVLQDLMERALASGWWYRCFKKHCGSTAHMTEAIAIDPDSQATAGTDVESEPDIEA